MHETLWFTKLLNYLFASPVNGFLGALGIHPHNPAEPIPNYMAMQVLVALILVAMVLFLRSQLSLDTERPLHPEFPLDERRGGQAGCLFPAYAAASGDGFGGAAQRSAGLVASQFASP